MFDIESKPHFHDFSFALGKLVKNNPHGFAHVFKFDPTARVNCVC